MITEAHIPALDSCAAFLFLFCCKETYGSCSYKRLWHLRTGNFCPAPFFFFFWLRSMACGILVPWPRIQGWMEPMPPAVGAQSLNHWTAREVLSSSLYSGPDFGGGGKSAPLNFQGVKGKPLSEPLKRTGRSNPHASLSALIINPHAHLFVLYVPVWHGKQTLKIIWFLAGLYEFKWYECACTFLQRLMLEGLGARHSIQGVALPTN